MQIVNFIMKKCPKQEKYINITFQRVEKISRKRGLVLNFELATYIVKMHTTYYLHGVGQSFSQSSSPVTSFSCIFSKHFAEERMTWRTQQLAAGK